MRRRLRSSLRPSSKALIWDPEQVGAADRKARAKRAGSTSWNLDAQRLRRHPWQQPQEGSSSPQTPRDRSAQCKGLVPVFGILASSATE